jgi:hypothetical protein
MEGKFLQLRLGPRDHLLLAAASEHRYHNQLLARYLAERGIPHRWEGAARLVVDRPGVVVIGGGRFRLDLARRSLRVWDESSRYGRFEVARLEAQLRAVGPPWDRIALVIG